jgi:hypothetical protein
MSKRHQVSRRRSYGRRQHEVRERTLRRREHELLDVRVDAYGAMSRADALGLELDQSRRAFGLASPAD